MKKPQFKLLLSLLLVCLLLVFLDSRAVLNPIKNPIQTALAPAQYLFYKTKISVRDALSFITFWKSGEARIKYLESKVIQFEEAKNKVMVLEKENQELKNQLGVAVLKSKKQIPAVVLGAGRYLEIGAGLSQGVVLGQTVVYGDNLVGKVIKVSNQVSFVQMPTDSQAKIAAKIGLVRGLVKGEFNFTMTLSQIAQNEEIKAGDLVLTSGEGSGYLPGLTIGKISNIKQVTSGIFKEAEIKPIIDFSRLEIVFVIAD